MNNVRRNDNWVVDSQCLIHILAEARTTIARNLLASVSTRVAMGRKYLTSSTNALRTLVIDTYSYLP